MRSWFSSLGLISLFASSVFSQDPRAAAWSGLYKDSMAPGVIGRIQLERNPRLRGCYQPIEISGPQGLKVSFAEGGDFAPLQPTPARAGFAIGAVYRVKVTNIPLHEGTELFPTIEVIDRLYPPPEREHRFPIPIVLEQDDLERALEGEMVTRVIYLEDSEIATPVSYADGNQRVVELTGREDALQTADQLGRPMAILRIGSRVPDASGIDMNFLYGCPPWTVIKEIPERSKLIKNHGWPEVELPQVVPAAPDKLEARRPSGTQRTQRTSSMRVGG